MRGEVKFSDFRREKIIFWVQPLFHEATRRQRGAPEDLQLQYYGPRARARCAVSRPAKYEPRLPTTSPLPTARPLTPPRSPLPTLTPAAGLPRLCPRSHAAASCELHLCAGGRLGLGRRGVQRPRLGHQAAHVSPLPPVAPPTNTSTDRPRRPTQAEPGPDSAARNHLPRLSHRQPRLQPEQGRLHDGPRAGALSDPHGS